MPLPQYDPGGTQRTQAQQANNASPDAFGGSAARALTQAGQQAQGLGGELMRLEKIEKDRDDAATVLDATAEASNRMRKSLYGEGGLFTRTGGNADGVTDLALETADTIGRDVAKRFKTPEQQAAFNRMWTGQSQSVANSAASYELKQKQEFRTQAKVATLSSLTDNAIAGYNDEEVIGTNLDQMRVTIRANPDGLPQEMVDQMERESISAAQVGIISRMAQDSPGRAADYYKRHKGDVNGADHAKVDAMLSGVNNVNSARQAVQEITGGGEAGKIVRSVIGAESGGNVATPDSPTGAAGLMQLQPDTAREVASSLSGMGNIAAMTDDELSAYWRTPAGVRANVKIGATYLNKQLATFDGDLEAALVAYNAGPANATKWLNAGRDYSALPKPEETLPYVKKVMGAYLGKDFSPGDSSTRVQEAAKATSYFQGDATAFLLGKLAKGQPETYITEMKPALQQGIAGLISNAPDDIKAGLGVISGTRSHERQAELWADALKKYGSAAAARKSVAPPEGTVIDGKVSKGSRHEPGSAADLGWNGQLLSHAPPAVVQWVHANAAKYGLAFPLGNENWHVETVGARSGTAAKGDRVLDPASRRVDAAFANQPDQPVNEMVGTVQLAPTTGNPADVYTQAVAPYRVAPDATNLADWLESAREDYADNPSLLAEVERQLTDVAQSRTMEAKAQEQQIKTDIFRSIVNGGKVKDYDQSALQVLGGEGVKSMLEFETAWNKESDETDPATYYKLSMMTGEELHKMGPDIVDYASKLSKTDLKAFIDKAGLAARDGGSAAKRSTDLTRTQIITNAQDILGLQPAFRTEDAKKAAALNRALDDKIGAYIEANGGREPNGVEMQKMTDELLIEGKVKNSGWVSDATKREYELTPEEMANFAVADAIDDIPEDKKPIVAQGFRKIWGIEPDETAAVDFYNDLYRVKLGAAPTPPAPLESRIRQGLATTLGRAPTAEEVAGFYREWIVRATAAP